MMLNDSYPHQTCKCGWLSASRWMFLAALGCVAFFDSPALRLRVCLTCACMQACGVCVAPSNTLCVYVCMDGRRTQHQCAGCLLVTKQPLCAAKAACGVCWGGMLLDLVSGSAFAWCMARHTCAHGTTGLQATVTSAVSGNGVFDQVAFLFCKSWTCTAEP